MCDQTVSVDAVLSCKILEYGIIKSIGFVFGDYNMVYAIIKRLINHSRVASIACFDDYYYLICDEVKEWLKPRQNVYLICVFNDFIVNNDCARCSTIQLC